MITRRGRVVSAVAAIIGVALISAIAWVFVHPTIRAVLDNGEVTYANDSQTWIFGNDGWFGAITLVGGFLLSGAFLATTRWRNLPVGAIALGTVAMTAYALMTWVLGMSLDDLIHHGVSPFPPEHLAPGDSAVERLHLRAYGVMGVPVITWTLMVTFDAIFSNRKSSG